MTDNARRRTLLLLLLTIGLVALIAAGLPQLELRPGLPFPEAEGGVGGGLPLAGEPLMDSPLRAVYGLGIILGMLMLYLVYKMITGVPWKELLQPSIFFALLIITLTGLLLSLIVAISPRGLGVEEAYLPPTPEPLVTGPLGAPPPALIWLVWAGLALLVTLLVIGLVRWMRPRRQPDRLAREAGQALQSLRDGLDLKSVILRCYQQMSQALQDEQGLERDQAMTAREFERLLTERGVPTGPVQQLTRLFEAVRYGRQEPSTQEEQQAVDCLSAILAYSQERGPIESRQAYLQNRLRKASGKELQNARKAGWKDNLRAGWRDR